MNWNPEDHYQNQDVAIAYDRARFSSMAGRTFNYLEKRTITKCFSGLPRGGGIVDVPCGTGRLSEALLAAGYSVHGIDISDAMLQVAKRRLASYGDRFTCEVADIKKREPDAPPYDAALCARVLMHFALEQQIEFLSSVARVSRSIVVLSHSLNTPYQRFRRRLKHALGDRHIPVRHPLDEDQIAILLAKSGLREVQRYRLLPWISEAIYIVAVRQEPPPMHSRSATRH